VGKTVGKVVNKVIPGRKKNKREAQVAASAPAHQQDAAALQNQPAPATDTAEPQLIDPDAFRAEAIIAEEPPMG
jgi:hypothetical protein